MKSQVEEKTLTTLIWQKKQVLITNCSSHSNGLRAKKAHNKTEVCKFTKNVLSKFYNIQNSKAGGQTVDSTSELQIRGGIEDNSKIIFLISQ